MLRYFSKKLIAIHFLAIFAIITCLLLSNWQWHRAHYTSKVESSGGSTNFNKLSLLRDYLPAGSIGIKTEVTGTWQPDTQLEFAERPVNGKQLINPNQTQEAVVSWAVPIGSWIVNVLTLSDGSSLGVVRGWSANPETVKAPSGQVTLTGVMQPSENASSHELLHLPSYISTNSITSKAASTAHDGYFLSATDTGLQLVTPTYSTPIKVGLHWRNVVYVFNWIIFAIIIFGMWWRIIRDEVAEPVGAKNDR